jgi:hypothetical protein
VIRVLAHTILVREVSHENVDRANCDDHRQQQHGPQTNRRAAGAPARLDLHDVSGCCVASREVGTLDAGEHHVALAADHALPAGIYWVRLTQARAARVMRAAVLR